MPQKSYSYKEAAVQLGISLGHLKNLVRDGRGPETFTLGRRVLFSERALEEFIKDRERLG